MWLNDYLVATGKVFIKENLNRPFCKVLSLSYRASFFGNEMLALKMFICTDNLIKFVALKDIYTSH